MAKKRGKSKNKKKNNYKYKNKQQVAAKKLENESLVSTKKENNLETDFLKLKQKIELKEKQNNSNLEVTSVINTSSKASKNKNRKQSNLTDTIKKEQEELVIKKQNNKDTKFSRNNKNTGKKKTSKSKDEKEHNSSHLTDSKNSSYDSSENLKVADIVDNQKEELIGHSKVSNKWKVVVSISLAVIIVIAIILYFVFFPRIILIGDKNIVLNYKEKYKEPGYKAFLLRKNITSKVKISGHVNNKKLGSYKIKYTVLYAGKKVSVTRVVTIKDLAKPVISLNGYKKTYVCPNEEYKEEGYRAYDNYDGNITKRVKVQKEKDYYIYSVRDKAKNKRVIKRQLVYEDNVNPVISVKESVFINQGDSFKKEYFATDNCDKDITKKVKVEGEVDSNKVGDYKVIYSVLDKAGNLEKVEQIVHVTKKDAPGTIYLTFDDGPQEGTTNVILDILRDEGVKATFFITNKGPDELVQRENNEGHSVAIHTATHDYSNLYSSVDAYYNDLKLVQDRILRLTGKKSMLIRFPGGSSNTISRRFSPGIMSTLTEDVLKNGYRYYDWNINSGDADVCRNSECVYNKVINSLSHERVNMVLMHDIKPYTRDALKNIIKYAKDNGYTFAAIDNNTQMVRQRVNN